MEDFIFIEIISFYIVLQTLNPSKAGPPGIVHFKKRTSRRLKKIENFRYVKILHLLRTVTKKQFLIRVKNTHIHDRSHHGTCILIFFSQNFVAL